MENFVEIEEYDDLGYSPADIPLEMDKVNIIQRNISVWTLLKRIEGKEMQLEGYFQRKTGLWDNATKSRLIESIIAGLPISSFYFDGSKDESWLVVDGLQRISAIKEFVIDKTLTLTGLYFYPSTLNNKTFEELSRPYQRRIEEYSILAYIIQAGTPRNVKYKLFRNINISSLPFSNQEIRHAINPGRPANYIIDISQSKEFVRYITSKLPQNEVERMLDREIALRYIAFRMTYYTDYKPTISDFLDKAMTKIYIYPQNELDIFAKDLENTLEIINQIFGNTAFTPRMMGIDSSEMRFSIRLFERWTFAIANRLPSNYVKREEMLDKLFSNKERMKKQSQNLVAYEKDIFKSHNSESIKIGFSVIEQLIENILND